MENNRWPSNGMDLQATDTQYYSSRKNTKKMKGRECCMCGDVGFQERLFRCQRCHHRFQHIYCSRLYSDQLELDGISVCDWCLDFETKYKVQSHKRKNMKDKEAAGYETVSRLGSTSAMKQPALVTIEKPRKADAKSTLKLHVKFGGSKQDQSKQPSLTENMLSSESCRNLPRTPRQSSPTKGRLVRRFKLLSDVLS